MNKSHFLYNFIQQLSKSEKRFFRLYTNLYQTKRTKNYLLLFDVLEGLKEYDEQLVLKKIEDSFSYKQLHVVKKYLKKQLFQCFHIYHRRHIRKIDFYHQLSTVEFLIERKQYSEAHKISSRQKKESEEQEYFIEVFDAYKHMIDIKELENNRSTVVFDLTDSYYEEALINLKKLEELTEIRRVHNQIRKLVYSPKSVHTDTQAKLENLLQNVWLKKDITDIKGTRAKYYYLHCKVIIYGYLKTSIQQEVVVNEQLLYLMENNKHIFSEDVAWISLVNISALYISLRNTEGFYAVMRQLNAIIEMNTKFPINNLKYWKYIRLCSFYIEFPEEKIPENLLKDIQTLLTDTKNPLNISQKTGLIAMAANYHFVNQNYEKAKQLLDEILLEFTIKTSSFYFISTRLVYILSYYELNDIYLAEKELQSFKRKMNRDDLNSPIMKTILKVITNIIHTPTPKKHTNLLNHYKRIVDVIANNQNNGLFTVKVAFLAIWAERKLQLNNT